MLKKLHVTVSLSFIAHRCSNSVSIRMVKQKVGHKSLFFKVTCFILKKTKKKYHIWRYLLNLNLLSYINWLIMEKGKVTPYFYFSIGLCLVSCNQHKEMKYFSLGVFSEKTFNENYPSKPKFYHWCHFINVIRDKQK